MRNSRFGDCLDWSDCVHFAAHITPLKIGKRDRDYLGAILVREGLAWAFVRYSRDDAEQEAKAKADRLGIHAHDCEPAWEWRASQRSR